MSVQKYFVGSVLRFTNMRTQRNTYVAFLGGIWSYQGLHNIQSIKKSNKNQRSDLPNTVSDILQSCVLDG